MATEAYIAIASVMVFLALVLRPCLSRIINVAVAIVAVINFAGAVGEWSCYIVGSGIEVALLAARAYYAWPWPRLETSD